MKKTVFLLSTAAFAILLSACSTLASLIPDQEVEVLGTQEELTLPVVEIQTEEPETPSKLAQVEEVEAVLPELPSVPSLLQTQASNLYVPFGFYRGVEDLSETLAISAKSLTQEVVLAQLELTGGSDSTNFPNKVELELGYMWLQLTDGFGGTNLEGWLSWVFDDNAFDAWLKALVAGKWAHAFADGKTIVLEKDTSSCSGGTCTYLLKVNGSDATAFGLDRTQIDKVLEILSAADGDEFQNAVSIDGVYIIKTSIDANLNAQLVFNTPDAILSFKE